MRSVLLRLIAFLGQTCIHFPQSLHFFKSIAGLKPIKGVSKLSKGEGMLFIMKGSGNSKSLTVSSLSSEIN